jgi:hypothetical protein
VIFEHFKWYRRWRRGRWTKLPRLIGNPGGWCSDGTMWIRLLPDNTERADEDYGELGQLTMCFCPRCGRELCSNPYAEYYEIKNRVVYYCNCGYGSKWDFSHPVPLLIKDSNLANGSNN